MMKTIFNVVNRQDLLQALTLRDTEVCINGRVGFLQSIEREDGSGFKFNVRIGRYDAKTMRHVTETLFIGFTK